MLFFFLLGMDEFIAELLQRDRDVQKRYYDKVRDDPEFKAKKNARARAYYYKKKEDPAFRAKLRKRSLAYYHSHKK